MTTLALLELTDGTDSIDLLRGGVYLKGATFGVPLLKNDGIWSDNAMATGRKMVDRRFGNVSDAYTLAISHANQDDTAARLSDLFRLLEKARDFTASNWQSDPVWLKRQAGCETNPTYALVYDYKLPEFGNIFGQPFSSVNDMATLDELALGIEHSIWLSEPPGIGACVQASTQHAAEINADWTRTATLPTIADFVYALLQS